MAGFFPIDTVKVSVPATGGAWQDLNLSAYIPAGANGIVGNFKHTDAGATGYGFRKKGSTDDRRSKSSGTIIAGVIVGCDANRYIQCNTNSSFTQFLYLIGYTVTPDVVINTNATALTPAVGSWQNVNLAALCPSATGIILEVYNSGAGWNAFGARMNGSSDNRTQGIYGHNAHDIVIGCDGSQLIQLYRGAATVGFYLRGYIISGCTFNVDAVEYTPTPGAGWEDMLIPSGIVQGVRSIATQHLHLIGYQTSDMAFFEVTGATIQAVGARKPGDALMDTGNTSYHLWLYSSVLRMVAPTVQTDDPTNIELND